jgi:hypothetical protein
LLRSGAGAVLPSPKPSSTIARLSRGIEKVCRSQGCSLLHLTCPRGGSYH